MRAHTHEHHGRTLCTTRLAPPAECLGAEPKAPNSTRLRKQSARNAGGQWWRSAAPHAALYETWCGTQTPPHTSHHARSETYTRTHTTLSCTRLTCGVFGGHREEVVQLPKEMAHEAAQSAAHSMEHCGQAQRTQIRHWATPIHPLRHKVAGARPRRPVHGVSGSAAVALACLLSASYRGSPRNCFIDHIIVPFH